MATYQHLQITPQPLIDPTISNLEEFVTNHNPQHCVNPTFINGSEEDIRETINGNETLARYFESHPMPPLLNGNNYTILSVVGAGTFGQVYLAQNNVTKQLVAMKASCLEHSRYLGALIKEYMFQKMANNALNGFLCTTPEPKGFVCVHSNFSPSGYEYILVSEFAAIFPDAKCTLTIDRAIKEHKNGKPLLNISDWQRVCLSLIIATDVLKANDLFHNDIKTDNVLISFDEYGMANPVIIDFGNCCHKINNITQPYYTATPYVDIFKTHVAPELYLQPQPHETSDLYSVAQLISEIGRVLEHKAVEQIAKKYKQNPTFRILHKPFHDAIEKGFGCYGMDLSTLEENHGPVYLADTFCYSIVHMPHPAGY